MEHALHFVDVIVEPFVLFAAQKLEIARKKDVILELTRRSQCDVQEPRKIGVAAASASLGDVR